MDADDLAILNETAAERIYHVYPVNDLRGPSVQIEDAGILIVHNSLDGREAFETGERKPS